MASARSSGAVAGQLGSIYRLGAAGDLTDGQLLERFLTRDDPDAAEAAFSELGGRHGSMVLAVCRRELGDPDDANDAFQATFLVLVSKAARVRHWDSLGGWLIGIARRVAARARVEGARRRRHLAQFGVERTLMAEGPALAMPAEPEPDYTPLIAEVARLPERFRAPVVLHYFEGLSAEATAQRLGCARGTVLSRLSRARNRLRQRLEDRGYAPAVLIPARWLPPIPVPTALALGTVRAASSLGLAGAAIESVVPAAVASLSRKVGCTLAFSRLRVAAMLLALAAGASIGLAATFDPAGEPRRGHALQHMPAATPKQRAARADQPAKTQPVAVRGRVLDPDGKPVAGAEIFLSIARPGIGGESRRLGMSRPDGHFEVNVPRASLEPEVARPEIPFEPALVAVASGLGPDWSKIDPGKSSEPVALRLRRDDVPIEGRIISLEGRPIVGASVKIAHIVELPPTTINRLRANDRKMNPALWGEMRRVMIVGEAGALRPTRTGADGRFRITGVGRDRLALVVAEGESIEQSFAMVSTSADAKPITLPADGSPIRKIEASRFEMTVAPGRAIQGTIRDRDTGEPIAGARVGNGFGGFTPTDHDGKFRIAGQPKGGENFVDATVEGQPYIKVARTWKDRVGLEPVKLEITLKRGVWVEGKVTDASSGKTVKAIVTYYPFRDNPNVKECPDASFLNNNLSDEVEFATDASGRFRAVALPDGGILAVRVTEPGYVTARPLDAKIIRNVVHPGDFQYYMAPYHALVPIDAPAGKTLVIPDIAVTAGRTQHITIAGPDGRPVAGARVLCLQVARQKMSLTGETISGSEWSFIHANPGQAEAVIISHVDRSLGATVELKGDEPDPIRIVLQRTGTVTGRLVGEDGQPRPNMELVIGQHFRSGGRWTGTERSDRIRTGPDGRFRIRTLVPGLSYHIAVMKKQFVRNRSLQGEGYLHENEWTLKPGESVDWGDVRVEAYPQ